ncbi:ABC transporter permease [Natrinema salinisoli]|uniref:ABC transporter permease n=1 Tax=Natrinema salinisoli TaxID=2878535 RepID=UPI001CF07F63|nr:ABC transporter permease [Natrinema salinisoli]
MKRTEDDRAGDDDPRTDGGTGDMFGDSEITAVTRRQRARETFDESVVAPFKVAWDDWRTKVALLILGGFVATALLVWLHQAGYTLLNDVLRVLGSPWELEVPRSPVGITDERRSVRPFENWQYPLGTFDNGVDILSALLWATPGMLQMVLAGGVFSTAMATVVGTVSGYKGGTVESVLNTIVDIAMSIPGLPLVVVLVAIIQPSSPYVIGVLITINIWAGLARTIHSQVLSLREKSYVEASRTMGISTPQIIRKDILPNLMPYITVNFVYAARRVVYDSIALYYLGLLGGGMAENWGVMLDWAYNLYNALTVSGKAYMLLAPMVPIVALSMALILLSQGTDRLFNPRVRTRHAGETVQEDDTDCEVNPPA